MASSTATTSTTASPATVILPPSDPCEIASTAKPGEVFVVGNNHLFTVIKKKLKEDLIKEREVVSITGMGGIGKTTLAKKIYEDKDVKSHFDIRAWVTVSQSFSSDDMLQKLLQSLNRTYDPNEGLKEQVRKSLLGMRYLIVIDDIWSIEAWNDTQICFPKQSTRSRVLLTTRLKDVATHASSGGVPYSIPTLNEKESWDLFYNKVFEKESYPCDEFEEIGWDIAMKCKGLPLAIVVIAGVLSKAKKKVEDWKNIAEDVKAALLTSDEEQSCEKILSLSYEHLPHNLKTCFLYLGVFPEDYEIPVRRLVGYWANEEFLEVEANKREEVAWQRLQDLIDRNLVFVGNRGSSGRMKTCKVHDLIHDKCLRLTKEKNILHVIDDKLQVRQSSRELRQENGYCWIGLQSIPKSFSHICECIDDSTLHKCHSFLLVLPFLYIDLSLSFNFNLFKSVKVLDLGHFTLPFLPSSQELYNLHHLRYLHLNICNVPESFQILNLKNLRVLILGGVMDRSLIHVTISNAPQLMDLCFFNRTICLNVEENSSLLENMTSVLWLSALCCINKDRMMKIPNVKKLGICFDEEDYKCSRHPIGLLNNLSHLHQLENLSYSGPRDFNKPFQPMPVPIPNDFPPQLKKLTLERTRMEWKIMNIIGRLPNLEMLKLCFLAFRDSKWKQTKEGFQKLKVLVFESLSLHNWEDSDYFFPSLERLVIKSCYRLKTLPFYCLSECPNLKLIDLEMCSKSLLTSARQIQEDGDGVLEVHFSSIVEDPPRSNSKVVIKSEVIQLWR